MGRKLLILASLCILISFYSSAQNSLEFVENKGQWEKQVQFKGEIPSGSFFIQQNGFTVLMHNAEDMEAIMDPAHHGIKQMNRKDFDNGKAIENRASGKKTLRSHAYNVWFENASPKVQVIPEKAVQSVNNYFIGNDPSKWTSGARIFQSILYKNMYDGIDVRYYSEGGKIKYDLIVHPGANPDQITLRYEGADKLSIKNRELIVQTSVGIVKELYPYTFEFSPATGRKDLDCKYVLSGNNRVKFQVRNQSPNTTLVIDPSLVFVSFTGSRANQYGFTATPGPDGSFYSGGIVFSEGFPTTPGAFQTTFQQGGSVPTDIGIMKFSSNGSQRLYATYLGGANNEYPHSLFSDPQGNLVVMGRTYSNNFPGTKVGPEGGADIVVAKLSANGSNLIGALRIGGAQDDGVNITDMQLSGNARPNSLMQNYGDDSRSEVILDGQNNIYVAAQTQSNQFPVTAGVFGTTHGGRQDGVVMKINPNCNGLIWASYLGGAEHDGAFVLALNPGNNDLYVAGATASSDFPGNKTGTIQGTFQGGIADGFVSIISNDGTTLRKSTFLATPALDIVYGIQFDRLGFPYVMGITRGNWTVLNASYSNPNSKQFVAKLRPDLSAYVYSTVFGSGAAKPNMSPVAFLVDRCENVYISGWGGWINPGQTDPFDLAGVAGMPTTTDALKATTDNKDFYFIVLQKNAAALLYGSFFGQNNAEGEHVDGGTSRFDQQGVIYQAICANCGGGATFPTTPGVVGPVNGALPDGCNLAALKLAFNFAGVASGPRPYFNNSVDSVGCAPFTVTLRDTVLNAKSYIWSFGDGTPDVTTSDFELTHTFENVGNYRVRLIAIDSNTCNIRDTAYLNIRVSADKANLNFNPTKLPPCESLAYRFVNTSTAPPGKPFGATSFIWDFGDGTPRIVSGTGTIDHIFPAAGTYNVRLILNDSNYCNAPDSMTVVLRVAPLVDARFEVPGPACAPFEANFVNTSLAGESFFWDFGDGGTSTDVNPVHTYNKPGSYTVTLIAVDPNTCNVSDTTRFTLVVSNKPTADFSTAPTPPEVNKPTVFTNLSTGGVRYTWYFGDGDSTVTNNSDNVSHQYRATGTYEACLVAYNQFGCPDTVCKAVSAIIEPLLDVPNAFTPGKFGKNAIIKVEGFGIARMTWKIYNRWGQKVFEALSPTQGWDGTFKGELQPMDVYAYTLDVEFSDGTKLRKTGDITLIR